MVVSSIDTLSTQSNGWLTSSESKISEVRERIRLSKPFRLSGPTIDCTVLRCRSCLGGSIAMNIGSWKSSSWSTIVMPPSDEKTPCEVSTVMMSL